MGLLPWMKHKILHDSFDITPPAMHMAHPGGLGGWGLPLGVCEVSEIRGSSLEGCVYFPNAQTCWDTLTGGPAVPCLLAECQQTCLQFLALP